MSGLSNIADKWFGKNSDELGDFFDPLNLFHSGKVSGSGGGIGAGIVAGYEPAFAEIRKGTRAASGLLRQSFEEQFRGRAAGIAGAQREMNRTYGSEYSSQGLSSDVARRLLNDRYASSLMQLGAERGGAGAEYNAALAELMKGTGSELAGLTHAKMTNYIAYQSAKKGYKAAQAGGNAAGGGAAVGGIIAAISDRRLKTDIVHVDTIHGNADNGGRDIPIYEYRYKEPTLVGRYRGVMADEVAHIPGVVSTSPSGFFQVDYLELERITGIRFEKLGAGSDEPVEVAQRKARRRKKGAA